VPPLGLLPVKDEKQGRRVGPDVDVDPIGAGRVDLEVAVAERIDVAGLKPSGGVLPALVLALAVIVLAGLVPAALAVLGGVAMLLAGSVWRGAVLARGGIVASGSPPSTSRPGC
jgi:hypothetical protein